MTNAQAGLGPTVQDAAPGQTGDFYRITDVLDAKERATLARVRAFLEREVAPIIEDHWARAKFPFEIVDGLRNLDDGYVPPIFTDNHGEELLDRKVIVRARESVEWTRRLLDECGVFAGISSGAAMAGAAKAAEQMDQGTIVVLLPDGGWKYLSSGAWTDPIDEVVDRATRINYW